MRQLKILWIPHTGWHIPQRAHLFCRALAKRHELHVTDWVADFRKPRDYFSRRYLRNFTYRRYQNGPITVHGVPRFSPALSSTALRHLNMLVFSHLVRHIIQRHKIETVVGTFVLRPPQARRLVFDLFDDNVSYWRDSGRHATYADEIETIERRYLKHASVTVASSAVLADWARALEPQSVIVLIPNGVDTRRFLGVDGARIRHQFDRRAKLVGSIGNHDNPLELDKLLATARLLSDQDIIMLIAGRGAAIPAARKAAELQKLSNVCFCGYVPFADVPAVMGALDVGLCPYAKSPMDAARSPLRLLEYTAAGLPAVCTDLDEVRRMALPNVVLVDDDASSLAWGIRQALRMPRQRPPQIEQYDIRRLAARYEALLID